MVDANLDRHARLARHRLPDRRRRQKHKVGLPETRKHLDDDFSNGIWGVGSFRLRPKLRLHPRPVQAGEGWVVVGVVDGLPGFIERRECGGTPILPGVNRNSSDGQYRNENAEPD